MTLSYRQSVGARDQLTHDMVREQSPLQGEDRTPVVVRRWIEQLVVDRAPRRGLRGAAQQVESNTFVRSQLEHHALDIALLRGERLATGRRRTALPQRIGVRARMPDVPPADAADMTVRARADTPPVAVAPISLVVPAARRVRR